MKRKNLHRLAKYTIETLSPVNIGNRSIDNFFVSPQLKTADGSFVSSEDLFNFSSHIIVVGSPGTGKTTLLHFFSGQQAIKYVQEPKNHACPIFITGRDLIGIDSLEALIEKVSDVISKRIATDIVLDDLRQYFSLGHVSLIVDGLDEIPDQLNRTQVIYVLNDFSRYYPVTHILLSSRPSDLTISFSGFSYLYLSGFENEQIRQLIFTLSKDTPEMAERFLLALSENRALKELAATPLLLMLLWNVFQVRGQLPQAPTFLYSDFTDYLLSTLEKRREVKSKSRLTLYAKHHFLENIAIYLFEKGGAIIRVKEIDEIISKTVREFQIEEYAGSSILNELLSSGILIEISLGTFQFAHLSFQEYYVARALVRTPQKLINLIANPNANQVLVFACGLIDDVAPIIEAAIERGHVILAAKCISNGRTDNKQLAEYVAQEFVREVGEPFADLFIRVLGKRTQEATKEDPYSILLRKWDSFSQDNLPSHIKGSRFEEFVVEFFSQVFAVVSHDLNTENGELDIIVEIIKQDPFWVEFGGDAFVECKNWSAHIPLKDVGSFIAKVSQGRLKLSFFVSVSGFTEDARQRLRHQASNISAPLIVPIEGNDMKEMLLRREYFEEFFKKKFGT